MKKILAHPLFIPVVIVAVLGLCFLTIPAFRETTASLWGRATGADHIPAKIKNEEGPAELVFEVSFKTRDGKEIITGLLIEDQPERVMLRLPGGGDKTIERKDIDPESMALTAVGLHLTDEAVKGVRPDPKPALDPYAKDPKDPFKLPKQRALPPQFGTINYDNERLFQIRSRFPGEAAQFKHEREGDGFKPRYEYEQVGSPLSPQMKVTRPLRVGDKVEQNELLAVVWSQPLGQAKSALMDAICSLALSQRVFQLKETAFKEAALALASLMAQERQVQSDMLVKLSAERSLWTWKMSKEDIKAIMAEAEELRSLIINKKLPDPNSKDPKEQEAWSRISKGLAEKWSRVEIRAPIFRTIKDANGDDVPDPSVVLTIVEKNTNLNDMLDPTATQYPLYKLADLSRLQVMIQPHEEYYPILRSQLAHDSPGSGKLNWKLEISSLPNDEPLSPPIANVLPSLDPGLRTCIVTGYIKSDDLKPRKNKEGFQGHEDGWFGKYLVGQFITATIFVDPEKNTVEIPTDALYEAEGESLVFVQDPKDKATFLAKRVSVVQRLKEFTYVRSELTQRDRDMNAEAAERGKRRIEPLNPGDLVVTHGVVQLNRAFDNLSARDRVERMQNQGK